MDKILYFGINNSSKIGKLSTVVDRPDHDNGEGKYLGLIKINEKHYVVTLALTGYNKGHIVVNEILVDSYIDGETTFYYCTKKSRNTLMLEEQLNRERILHLIKDEDMDFYTVLGRIGEIKKSPLRKNFENEFYLSDRILYPEGYNLRRAIEEGKPDEYKTFERIPVERTTITGINEELFESLRQVTEKNYSSSLYSQAIENESLKKQIEELTQQIQRQKRESEDKRDGFHRF